MVAILADLPEIAAFGFRKRGHRPIIDHQYINASESGKQIAKAAVGASDRQVAEQRLGTGVERRVSVAARLLGPARWQRNCFRVGRMKDSEQMAKIDVLDACYGMLGDVTPMGAENKTIPAGPLSIDDERQAGLDRLSKHAFELGWYDRNEMPEGGNDE